LGGETFSGSYEASLQEVLTGSADLAAVWASPVSVPSLRTAADDLPGDRASRLRVVALTGECPNDGVVLSPHIDPGVAAQLERAFLTMTDSPGGQLTLSSVFDAERFERAPRGSYRRAYQSLFGSHIKTAPTPLRSP
jgi:phosphonate transport system substrate-binding protein